MHGGRLRNRAHCPFSLPYERLLLFTDDPLGDLAAVLDDAGLKPPSE